MTGAAAQRRVLRALAGLLVGLLLGAWGPATALADGDPGSDVLVHQPLFLAGDAGVSVPAQVRLDAVLRSAARAGVPLRVAIIAHRDDLGAVTALWAKPRMYARFLGYELSLAYRQRLLVVMPDGFGVSWPGHSVTAADRSLAGISIGRSGDGLVTATRAAVTRLAATAGVTLPASGTAAAGTGAPAPREQDRPASASGGGVPGPLIVLLGVVVLGGLGAGGARALRRRTRAGSDLVSAVRQQPRRRPADGRRRWTVSPAFLAAGAVAVATGALVVVSLSGSSPSSARALATNPNLDPGSPLSGRPAPDFTLSDQSGRPVSLHSYRGKVVILDFNDSECSTICPLTTTAMLDAKRMLGPAGARVQLLGVDANPKATSIEDVLSYSQLHGMQDRWRFLTGSLPQLRHVWRQYGVQSDIERGLIAHTPALYMLDPRGRLRRLYITQQSYSAVRQLGQVLAKEASRLLPGHPRVSSRLPYTPVPTIAPAAVATLPTTGGQTVRLGPGRSPHLFVFFATWDREITSLGGQLRALDRYQSAAPAAKLPKLTAIDEGSVEPSGGALDRFLRGLHGPLSYPVAIDHSGRVADGYGVRGQPWFVLTSAGGRILWYWNVNAQGWLGRHKLAAEVRAALSHGAGVPGSAPTVGRQLAGSPGALAALHGQAGQLRGSTAALTTRIHALHGYPVVLNAWASWCGPCRQEFGLFAAASARYGRHVAFLGADTDDSAGDAHAFLAQHRVSYPSYETTTGGLHGIVPGGVEGLPTTIFIDRTGRVTYVHTGQYASQGTLDADIERYSGGG